MRTVRPLAGQVLIELLSTETKSSGGIELPNRTLSPEEVSERHASPEKPPGLIGIVKAVGEWPTIKNGMRLMPEFGLNSRVVISPNAGQSLQFDSSRRLKLVSQSQVLAVLQD